MQPHQAGDLDLAALLLAGAQIASERARRYSQLRGRGWASVAEVGRRCGVEEEAAQASYDEALAKGLVEPVNAPGGRRGPRVRSCAGGGVKLGAIAAGDVVLVSKGGRRFRAKVVGIRRGVVELEPIERGISYRHASARELVDHWRHARRRRRPGETDPQQAPPPLPPKEQLSLAGKLDTRAGDSR